MGLTSFRRHRELALASAQTQAEPVQEVETVPAIVEDKAFKVKKTKPEKE